MTTPTSGELREQVWNKLLRAHVAAYPLPPHGHHPNFSGAAKAAKQLVDALFVSAQLTAGDLVLSYPDYVLKPLRKLLLENGVNIIVPARYGRSYRYLDSRLVSADKAASIAGAERYGQVLKDLPPLKLSLLACVALAQDGRVLDKGYGFRLPAQVLELPIVTIIHPYQLCEDVPKTDIYVSAYATPDSVTNLSVSVLSE